MGSVSVRGTLIATHRPVPTLLAHRPRAKHPLTDVHCNRSGVASHDGSASRPHWGPGTLCSAARRHRGRRAWASTNVASIDVPPLEGSRVFLRGLIRLRPPSDLTAPSSPCRQFAPVDRFLATMIPPVKVGPHLLVHYSASLRLARSSFYVYTPSILGYAKVSESGNPAVSVRRASIGISATR